MSKAKTPAVSSSSPSLAGKRKIFLVDDHPIVRQGLAQLINNEADLIVVGQGEDAFQSLRAIRGAKPDLVMVDVSLKDSDGIELIKELKSQFPNLPALVVSMHDESIYAERALRAGAGGYVMKQEAPPILLTAVRTVLSGQVYVSSKMNAVLLQRMVAGKKRDRGLPMDRLTDRELEIFRMIGAGNNVKQIADKLCLSIKTIEAHREHIKEKLNFKNSAELLRFAIRNSPDT
ncbi:MAG TPA: response regulator transcription factor [Phycisphaerae bacterium]|nr:response regulator transcription factor [Phycisphaerae bacterium]